MQMVVGSQAARPEIGIFEDLLGLHEAVEAKAAWREFSR